MVRRAFIQKKVLGLYRELEKISYPIEPQDLIPLLHIDSRMASYKDTARDIGATTDEIARLCGSNTGATHYDTQNQRCLILYNDDNSRRALWTQCHEIGHIVLGHVELIDKMAGHENRPEYRDYEEEADYFAWNILAPLPVMKELKIKDAEEAYRVFGLSAMAAGIQFERFQRWMEEHRKTAWENDIVKVYKEKSVPAVV